jgi:hypothetical protein
VFGLLAENRQVRPIVNIDALFRLEKPIWVISFGLHYRVVGQLAVLEKLSIYRPRLVQDL